MSRTITARYLAPQAYARLLDTLADAHHDVDPVSVIVNALGEWANVWPAEIQADPHALPKCGLCG